MVEAPVSSKIVFIWWAWPVFDHDLNIGDMKKKLAKTNRSAMRKMQPVPLVYAQQIVTFTGGFFHENLNNLGEKWKFFVLDDDVH